MAGWFGGYASGGALYVKSTLSGNINACIFRNNYAYGYHNPGSGSDVSVGTLLIGNLDGCSFVDDSTSGSGGALSIFKLVGSIKHCTFNYRGSDRRLLYIGTVDGTIENCIFSGNALHLMNYHSSNTLTAVRNCLFIASESLADVQGWAILTKQKTNINNNTIVGPGIDRGKTESAVNIEYNTYAEEGQFLNNIFVDTERAIQVYVGVDMSIKYNQFYNVTDIVCQGENCLGNEVWWLEILLDNFRNNDYGDPLFFAYDSTYRIRPNSPCVNAGDPAYIPDPNETDIDEQPRIGNGRIDIGADEYYPYVLTADLYHNGIVSGQDFAILANSWLQAEPYCDIAPPGGDGVVDFLDLAKVAEEWLLTEPWY